jgi:branched-chain amino acid transport system ATP-binding protein
MLAVGRAMMTSPRLLLVDEPTAGLSPIMVSELLDVLRTARDSGATMLLVEQNVVAALRVADQVLVLEKGIVVYSGAAGAVDRDRLAQLLGIGPLLAAVSPPQRGSGNGRRGNVNGAHTRKEVPAT